MTLSKLPTASSIDSASISDQVNIDAKVTNLDSYLESVRIVMVNTTLPANIGSAARAMLTMGLKDLVIVKPKLPIDDESKAHAAGALSVLENSKVVDSLVQAIGDCHLIFAASSRQRHIPRPVVTPDEAAQIIINRHQPESSSRTKIAILFGREDRGLTNEELSLADYHIQIDANPDYPVLNVASAVQVIASFLYSRFLRHVKHFEVIAKPLSTHLEVNEEVSAQEIDIILRQSWDSPAINQQQKISLQNRIIELMHSLELVESQENDKLRELPNRLSRLLSRIQLDQKEYELLSAIIAKIKRQVED